MPNALTQERPHGRLFNFSAGPSTLPLEVLETIQANILNTAQTGMSILEMSHRSKFFDEVMTNAVRDTKTLLNLSDDYAVLFLQGGASLQFSMVPMNLQNPTDAAASPIDVVHSGYWSKMALAQLKDRHPHRVVASSEEQKHTCVPEVSKDKLNPAASYTYYCSNNTIEGTQFKTFTRLPNTPLVADMSSDFASRQLDYSQFDLIFAGAQKNLGPAGTTIVVLRRELANRLNEQQQRALPTMLQYKTHIDGDSRYNTPPTFGIYVCGLVLKWILNQGGLGVIEAKNQKKAQILYSALHNSDFYHCPIAPESRSLMNIIFRIRPGHSSSEALEASFIKEAAQKGLLELKGHRAVGGLRASLYNAFPEEGVTALVEFMNDFEKRNK
jgi:phosphoserine aminotransferase